MQIKEAPTRLIAPTRPTKRIWRMKASTVSIWSSRVPSALGMWRKPRVKSCCPKTEQIATPLEENMYILNKNHQGLQNASSHTVSFESEKWSSEPSKRRAFSKKSPTPVTRPASASKCNHPGSPVRLPKEVPRTKGAAQPNKIKSIKQKYHLGPRREVFEGCCFFFQLVVGGCFGAFFFCCLWVWFGLLLFPFNFEFVGLL